MRLLFGWVFVCTAMLGLPILYYYRPPLTWMDRFGMMTQVRFAYIPEPYFQIAMVIVALTGAFGVILIAASRTQRP
ncbi:MAG: hypothetical protein GC190_11940 [Alphaproteobacteria bacterium]|nr:hypothetical protein [Alphaproteobacteria bacterium]